MSHFSLFEREIDIVFLFRRTCFPSEVSGSLQPTDHPEMLQDTQRSYLLRYFKRSEYSLWGDWNGQNHVWWRRSRKRSWGTSGKNIVFGIYQRKGEVLTFPISSRTKETMQPYINQYTKTGSLHYADDWFDYMLLLVVPHLEVR